MKAGKVWKFDDNINTDLMVPGPVLYASKDEQRRAVFSANRPGWSSEVKAGDMIVAGHNFGMGSSRPAARSLVYCGISCLLAESLNGLFFRGAVNFGLVALECPGVHAAFEEGDVAQVDLENWLVTNQRTGVVVKAKPVPEMLLKLMEGGGIFPVLTRDGLTGERPAWEMGISTTAG